MKLDANALKYLSQDDFRTLVAVELGQRNHELVPVPLIESIAKLKHGSTYRCLKTLLRHHLVHHDNTKYDAFRLTYMGYDYLALRTLTAKGLITVLGSQIGVGKESDIYEASDAEGRSLILKLHRLGRTSFRAVKSKRDYLQHRSNYSWLYLSRLAAVKEFAFMKALGERGFPVPQAIECNRHAVLMSRVEGLPLVQIRELADPTVTFQQCCNLLQQLRDWGLVHCDFNEFNIMISEDGDLTCIDFPQMVSTSHPNAKELYERDLQCIIRFFAKKWSYVVEDDANSFHALPQFKVVGGEDRLDNVLSASGYTAEAQTVLNQELQPLQHEDDTVACASSAFNDTQTESDAHSSAADSAQDDGCEQPSVSQQLGQCSLDHAPREQEAPTALAAHRIAEERRLSARKATKSTATRNATKDKRHKSRRCVAQTMGFGW